jgi:acyl-CoA thioesterase-1
MIVTGLWFLTLITLALASVFGTVKMILTGHLIQSFIIIISIFVITLAVEATLLLVLRSHFITYKNFWNKQQPTTSNELVYVALGDSAAQGIGASTPDASYVKILAASMKSHTGKQVRIVNLSKTGAKIQDLIAEQLPKLKALRPDIVTIDIGANDIVQGTSQADMSRGYEVITRAISPYQVIFANLPDFMWGTQQRNTTEINKTIVKLCHQYGLKLADLHQATHQKMWSLNEFAADGFHPSNDGHRTWARSFNSGIESILAHTE